MESFGERIPRTLGIKSILDSYTFGNGNLRELLQNSDDAGATKQIFVLDARSYPTDALADNALATTQGPALISYNDTVFSEKDWTAIRTIHGSSKVADATQIGKYGIGFRSVYHITDTPHILSGDSLIIFDPHERLESFKEGGVRIPIAMFGSVEDQIRAFQAVNADLTSPFRGTAIRLPLRTPEDAQWSQIKPGVSTSVQQISDLFAQFVQQELRTVLLFLKHITSIELQLVNEEDELTVIGKAWIDGPGGVDEHRCFSLHSNCSPPRHALSIAFQDGSSEMESHEWFIHHTLAPQDEAVRYLETKYQGPIQAQLAEDKLYSHIVVAAPFDSKKINGQLFTLLPLPVYTGFPLHVNGIFALTSDRQNLRKNDPGVVADSPDRLRALWNAYMFHSVIPEAWAKMVHALTSLTERPYVFDMLPRLYSEDANALYWSEIFEAVLQSLMKQRLPVWPIYGRHQQKPRFLPLDSLLIIPPELSQNIDLCNALSSASLELLAIPEKFVGVYSAITSIKGLRILTPLEASAIIRKDHVDQLPKLSNSEKQAVLDFLLSTDEPEAIYGLPLVRTVSGEYIALHRGATSPQSDVHIIADGDAIRIFAQLLPSMVDISQGTGSAHLRQTYLRAAKARCLNVQSISLDVVHSVMQQRFDHLGICNDEEPADADTVDWLIMFWIWVDREHGDWREHLQVLLARFHVLPTDRNMLCRMGTGAVEVAPDDYDSRAVLAALGVPTLHPQLPTMINSGGHPISDLAFIVEKSSLEVEPKMRASVQRFFGERVQHASLAQNRLHRLRVLPLYRVLSQGDTTDVQLTSLPPSLTSRTILVNGWTLLPEMHDVVFLDGHDTYTRRLLELVDPAASKNILYSGDPTILKMAMDTYEKQTRPVQKHFVHATLDHLIGLPHPDRSPLWDKIRSTHFIPVGDSSKLQPPREVIDPSSKELTSIYPPNHLRLAFNSNDSTMRKMNVLGMLVNSVTREILVARLSELAETSPTDQGNVYVFACNLVTLLNDCEDDMLLDCSAALRRAWLPVTLVSGEKALCPPAGCWDDDALCDQVLPVVATKVSAALRKLLWDGCVSMDVVSQQCLALSKIGAADRLDLVIRRLGKEFCSTNAPQPPDELDTLASLIGDRPWIPTSCGKLVSSNYVLLDDASCGSFRQVRESLRSTPVKALLSRLGCHRTLSNGIIRTELQNRSDIPATEAISLLRRIKAPLDDESKKSLKVPCSDGVIRRVDEVYFADCLLGDVYHPRNLSRHKVHERISPELAADLGITMLSELVLDEVNEDPDDFSPSVDMRAFISATLREYSFQYSFNEFVANADDAGASEVTITIDEQCYSTKSLLNSQLNRLHEVPALLVQNDSVFSPDDLDGIRKVGVGSKAGEPQKIGRMGVGILSMYYWTDLPCLLTGDNMIWFDPSGHSLPKYRGRRRNGLLLPVNVLQERYCEHLHPFHDTVGAPKDGSRYPGTAFRLPLRKPGDPERQRLWADNHDAVSVLKELNTYYFIARHSLFFLSSVQTIKASSRTKDGIIRDLWRVSRRDAIALNHRFTEMSLELKPPSRWVTAYSGRDYLDNILKNERWLIATNQQALRQCDSHLIETHRVPQEVSCAIAVRIDAGYSEASDHRLFTGLPLPGKLALPVHLNGSFIPSQNRRNITLLPETSPEASYNRWILTELAAPLYVLAYAEIQRRATLGPERERGWWAPLGDSDDVTNIILKPLEGGGLQSTSSQICRSLTEDLLTPKDAKFLPSEDDEADGNLVLFLGRCQASLVVPTFPFRKHLRESFQHQYLDGATFRLLIEHTPTDCLSSVVQNPKLLEAAILYFHRIDPSLEALTGLRILPLRDGSNAPIPTRDEPAIYVSDLTVSHHLLASRFSQLRPMDPCTKVLVRCPHTNVKHFDGAGMRDLLLYRVGSELSAQFPPEESRWLSQLWSRMPDLNLNGWRDDLIDLPIIPTTRSSFFVSYKALDSDIALAWDGPPTSPTISAVTGLGLHVVDRQAIGDHHRITLTRPSPVSLLNAMFQNQLRVTGTECQWPIVARFLRDCTIRFLSPEAIEYYKLLPLWEATSTTKDKQLMSCLQFVLLPRGITTSNIRAFMVGDTYYAEYSEPLHYLSTVGNTRNLAVINEVRTLMKGSEYLSFPLHMTESEVLLYSDLLAIAGGDIDILVPDDSGQLVRQNSLYDPRNETFRSAFAMPHVAALRFPHNRVMQTLLRSEHGLITRLDEESAIRCAEGIDAQVAAYGSQDEGQPDGLVARAASVYRAINNLDSLVFILGEWSRLRNLRFIPRADERLEQLGLDQITGNATVLALARRLPPIVSLEELVLPGDDANALWTQKASFMIQPTVDFQQMSHDVTRHLCHSVLEQLVSLSQFARGDEALDALNRRIIHSSVAAGYQWLEAHAHDVEVQFRLERWAATEPIFLNVEDTVVGNWGGNWRTAQQLVVDLHYDAGGRYDVATFLARFPRMLNAAGVRHVRRPLYTYQPVQMDENELRGRFETFRKDDRYIDAYLATAQNSPAYPVHAVFLGACIDHFRDIWDWETDGRVNSSLMIKGVTDFSLKNVIEFAYTGTIPLSDAEDVKGDPSEAQTKLADLLDLLTLSQMWDVPGLRSVVTKAIIEDYELVRPENALAILERAEMVHADSLKTYCEAFIADNSELVDSAMTDDSE